jgi:hypothetical protein
MQLLKGFVSWFSIFVASFLFFLSGSLIIFFQVFTADNVKQSFRESGAYNQLVPAVIESSKPDTQEVGQLPIGADWLNTAASAAFPSKDLDQKTSAAIDGIFAWFDGTTQKPQFSIDFSPNKQMFADGVSAYARQKSAALTGCSLSEIPSNLDPYTANCLPPGVTPDSVAYNIRTDLAGESGFLGSPIISPETLKLNETGSPLEKLDSFRWLYQNKGWLLIVLPLLSLLGFIIGFWLAPNRRRALLHLTGSFISSTVSTFLIATVLQFGVAYLIDNMAQDAISRKVVGPAVETLAHEAAVLYWVFGFVSLAITVGMMVVQRRVDSRGQ